ncbi:MAG: hypothetical protein INQ03_25320 [Candidatus Heimdallarchaeota archaeon]|nr:hypothetical protein [Candidatus Heimdallarchaeota archaeon]
MRKQLCRGHLETESKQLLEAHLEVHASKTRFFRAKAFLITDLGTEFNHYQEGSWVVGRFYCRLVHHDMTDHIYDLISTDEGYVSTHLDDSTESLVIRCTAIHSHEKREENSTISRRNSTKPNVKRQE